MFFTCFRRRRLTISLLTQTYFTKFTKARGEEGGLVFFSFSSEDVNVGTIWCPRGEARSKLRKHSVNKAYSSALSKGSKGERDAAALGGWNLPLKEAQATSLHLPNGAESQPDSMIIIIRVKITTVKDQVLFAAAAAAGMGPGSGAASLGGAALTKSTAGLGPEGELSGTGGCRPSCTGRCTACAAETARCKPKRECPPGRWRLPGPGL